MTADTQSLIARLEAATGWDDDLDLALAEWAQDNLIPIPPPYYDGGPINYDPRLWLERHDWRPTASIDAALTLVPPAEEWPDGHTDFTLDFQSGQCVCDFTCWARDGEDISVESPLYVRAPTPALAIVIAALKARVIDPSRPE